MKALVVKVTVKREHRTAFLAEMRLDALSSVRDEAGCLLFHVLADDERPEVIHLYELYRDEAAIEAHKATPHFLRWVALTAAWLAGPVEVRVCTPLDAPAKTPPSP
ncbi:MAG: antibiotic biosynthesis monooxygenase [Deltaproteobacteria bacterium]|nr:antibiotic biosynthesis monooxygenase [Deltaproteobacteria bacterium]